MLGAETGSLVLVGEESEREKRKREKKKKKMAIRSPRRPRRAWYQKSWHTATRLLLVNVLIGELKTAFLETV